ncbi:MAG: TonB family protein [Bacteroidales bacterium]
MKQILFIALFAIAAISVKAQDTTYYNNKGVKVKSVEFSHYYTVDISDWEKADRTVQYTFLKSGIVQSQIRFFLRPDKTKVLDGLSREWFPNGRLKRLTNFTNGKIDGRNIFYDENGHVLAKNAQTILPKKDTAKVSRQIIIGDNEDEIVDCVESMPEYKGGDKALMKYLKDSLIYPKIALENRIRGRVIVRFLVDEKGQTSQISVLRGIGSGCDEEAIRLIQKMPLWIPAKQGGRSVAIWYTLPIMFTLKR